MSSNLARQARLLLMLTAALAGFFLVLEFLVSLLSSGPQDILAETTWQVDTVGLPNGVGLLESAVLGVSLVLAVAVVIASAGWPLTRASFRPSFRLDMGAIAALVLAGVGAYLAFSGVLGENVAYSEHIVHRSILEPGGLALIAVIFLTLIVAGFINRYALGILIVAWLAAASVFGFLDPRPVDGLYLFERPEKLEVPADYGDIVERYQQTDASLFEEPEEQTEPPVLVEIQPPPVVNTSVVADVTVEQLEAPPPVPLFWVSGAYHTRYLRTATGDVYENGTWTQLDPGHLPVDGDTLVPDSVLAALGGLKDAQLLDLTPERLDESLLVYPTIVPAQYVPDVVIITPYFEKDSFAEGVVPSADYMVRVHASAAFYPFSGTLRVSAPIGSYQLNTTIPQFAPGDIFDAVPAQDATYLQLPENLPVRVLELAEQFKGDESPYIRANRLHGFLREKYGYATLDPGRTVIERPAWHDPVDWFLFERRWGDSRSFSSAFAILARAAGIPARVVAGWAIDASEEPQVVNANQAHQWAEIALDGIGWVRFDPTRHDAFPPDDVEPPLPMLVEELESSEDPQEREEAAEALGELGEPEALPSLVEAATNDESLAVQLAAVSSIHRIGVDELIQLLLYHEDPLIREAAADGLRVAGSSKGVDALRQALASDEDERVRTAAVKALEKIGGEKAELGLLDAAVNDESAIVRETAVRALGELNLGSAVDEIVTLLREDDSGAVREAAAWALGELEQPESLRALLDSRSGDPVEAVRAASEEALHAWGLAALAHVLQESDDPEQRIVAAQLLGELGDDEAVPFLGRALNDADASVRDAALGALQTLGAYVGLENGSGLLSNEAGFNSLIGGTTTLAATEPLDTPVFRVKGAHHTGYLRTSVGEVYAEGRWLALEATGHAHETFTDALPHGEIQPKFFDEYAHTDKITVSRLIGVQQFPAGFVPTSKRLDRIEARGTFWKERATFSLAAPTNSYSWTSKVETLSDARLNAAGKWTGPSALSYTALPDWVRQGRIHDLAVEITAGHSTPYAQAKAIERYLRTTYTYRFAESPEDAQPPEGRDAVDWFLFDKQEGTCGSFSSAFVLARPSGRPPGSRCLGLGHCPDSVRANGLGGPGAPMGRGGSQWHWVGRF